MVRRPAFNPSDRTALAKARIKISERHDEQNWVPFWTHVLEIFEKQERITTCKRTAEILRSRWIVLQLKFQKYLSAEKTHRSRNVSVETEDDILANSMRR